MGWQDRRYNDDGGGGVSGAFGRALKRIFVEGDNFFAWAVPLFSVRGIRVKIHIFYIVYIIIQLFSSLRLDTQGVAFAAFGLAAMFTLVLLHEFGHCLMCRRVGGEADQIVMWPLGGLAMCRPPHDWKANLYTTLAGPAVNLALAPVFGLALIAAGARWEMLAFNPFTGRPLNGGLYFEFITAYWKAGLWSLYVMNAYLFLFNMLLVMFPMDAGRVVQEVLWARMGYRKSMSIATNLGLAMAVLVGALSIFFQMQQLTMIAVFCGVTCFQERRKLAMVADEGLYDLGKASDFGYGPRGGRGAGGGVAAASAPAPDRSFELAAARQRKEREHQAEVDRILEKIAKEGMGALNRSERKTLQEETDRRNRATGKSA